MGTDGARAPKDWKVQKSDGSRLEPANLSVLRHWVETGQIEADDLVINEDLSDWIRAAEALDLFDLFERQEPGDRSGESARQSVEFADLEIKIPDCAYHPGQPAAEICVGCGKFVCKECGERFESKLYCRRCLAEKQVGAEPGLAAAGPVAQIIPGVRPAQRVNRFSLASVTLSVVAILCSFLMISPRFRMAAAPAVGFISFLAALLGAIGLGNLRSTQLSSRSKQFALSGLLVGLSLLILSVMAISLSIRQFRSGSATSIRGNQLNSIAPQTARRQPIYSKQMQEERDANSRQLLDQLTDQLNAGQLEGAVSTARTLVGLYPETDAARITQERLPLLENALEEKRVVDQESLRENEERARQRLEYALKIYSDGNLNVTIDLLRSIVENFPTTETAKLAEAELKRIEGLLTNQRMKQEEEDASRLARQARERMEMERYEEAADIYRRLLNQYPATPTAVAARADLAQAQLLLSDASEREFRRIQKQSPDLSYEDVIPRLQEFLAQYPSSARFEEANRMLQDHLTNKSIADGLYTFGKTYLSERKYSLALGRYDKLINEHPRSQWTAQARKDREHALEKLKE
ncbi:MAG: hypothetical protein C4520_03710 [Candidatus Abyssobacteria bacterium SURF_5]|uniref:Uncharacterized protein n=1 Tax=Abyssobacteria bacterium (strain SURF_5) TaxID=2093360 RepID=A0A3A4NVV7_ABYX5|nr:MAG: hypothetical protein C4520_03710 [Candidatus Abyssubacteria bacterium SURF_5]